MLYFVNGHKCLILDLVHSGMGMNTMIHTRVIILITSIYLVIGFNNGIEKLNFKGLYLHF